MNDEKNPGTRYIHIGTDGKLTHLHSIPECLAAIKKSGYIWFDFHSPTREDLNPLVEPFSLHPLAIEDCLDMDQVPKIDDFVTNTFILFNSIEYIDKVIYIDELDFFLGKNFLVTVSPCHTGNRNFFSKLDDMITRNMVDIRRGPDFLLHIILDFTVDRKFQVIEALQEELDDAEEMILNTPENFKPEMLLRLRKSLLMIRKSLFHEREIMIRICRKDSPYITEKAIFHFRDIYDHLAKFFEAIEIYREMITSLMEMYLSLINTRMAKVGNRLNRIVRRLTLINTIFMPLTLLAGIGGMSEWSMMTGPENWKWAYPLFFVLMGGISIASYFILKRLEAKDSEKNRR